MTMRCSRPETIDTFPVVTDFRWAEQISEMYLSQFVGHLGLSFVTFRSRDLVNLLSYKATFSSKIGIHMMC